MPLPIALAHRLMQRLSDVEGRARLPFLSPTQRPKSRSGTTRRVPVVETVIVSSQHAPDVSLARVREASTKKWSCLRYRRRMRAKIPDRPSIRPGRSSPAGRKATPGSRVARSSSTATAARAPRRRRVLGQGRDQGGPFGRVHGTPIWPSSRGRRNRTACTVQIAYAIGCRPHCVQRRRARLGRRRRRRLAQAWIRSSTSRPPESFASSTSTVRLQGDLRVRPLRPHRAVVPTWERTARSEASAPNTRISPLVDMERSHEMDPRLLLVAPGGTSINTFRPAPGSRQGRGAWQDLRLADPRVRAGAGDAGRFRRGARRTFVEDVLSGRRNNGFGNRSPAVAASLPHTTGSMVTAARYVLENGGVACAPCWGSITQASTALGLLPRSTAWS